MHPSVQLYATHVNPAFVRLLGAFGYGRVFERARGMHLTDSEGRDYVDFLAAFGSANLGHNPQALKDAIVAFLGTDVPNLMHTGPQVGAAELARDLAAVAHPLTISMFSLSGGEAVEAGLKLARAATARPTLLYCKGGYHGTNLGSLSVMGQGRMRDPFEPLVPECRQIPFGDLKALEAALKAHKVAAFLVEPIQAEAGVVLPPKGYLADAQRLCTKHGALLVLDEVQTGMGRTGSLFAYEQEGFVPDVLVLGKALGGGLVPISATLTRTEVHERAYGSMERFDLHGSTYSGNALSCAVAREVLRLTSEEDLARRAKDHGDLLVRRLREVTAGHPLVRDVRGRGLLVALELGPTGQGILNRLLPGVVSQVSKRVFGQWLSVRLLERGIICQPASQQWNVLKLSPPLTAEVEDIERVVGEIGDLLAECRDVGKVLRDAGERLGSQVMSGWSFR